MRRVTLWLWRSLWVVLRAAVLHTAGPGKARPLGDCVCCWEDCVLLLLAQDCCWFRTCVAALPLRLCRHSTLLCPVGVCCAQQIAHVGQ